MLIGTVYGMICTVFVLQIPKRENVRRTPAPYMQDVAQTAAASHGYMLEPVTSV